MSLKKTKEEFYKEIDQITRQSNIVLEPYDQPYKGTQHSYTWKCLTHNYTWLAPFVRIKRGHGCPLCKKDKISNANTIKVDEFLMQLEKRNSKLPSISYVSDFNGMTKKAVFQCDVCNYTWKTLPKSIIRGSGCPKCKAQKNSKLHMYTHEQFLEKIAKRNSKHENKIYVVPQQTYNGYKSKIKFICEKGHEWYSYPEIIWNDVSGCPHCAGIVKRGTKAAFEEILKKHPTLKIISSHGEQLGRRELIEVRCINGHEWETHYERLINGHGCPHCYGNAKMSHEQFLNKLNKLTRTILPLSTYESSHKPITVKCSICEYKWKPKPYNLLQGYGCPNCSRNNKFSKKALIWLKYMEITNNITIRHANKGGEYKIPGTHYKCDGFCEETNTVYEFYGDYWHGNPKVYCSSDYNIHLNKSFGELYRQTIAREEKIRKLGYNIISVWEKDYDEKIATTFLNQILEVCRFDNYKLVYNTPRIIKFSNQKQKIIICNINQPPEKDKRNELLQYKDDDDTFILFSDEIITNSNLVLNKLNHYAQENKITQRVHARTCEIKQCSKEEKRQFLEKNHIQGNDNSQVAYGAYYNDKLVAIMTFSSPRTGIGIHKNKSGGEWELVRFCTDINCRIPGIASKLLKHFQCNHVWTEIYSYADKRWSAGNLYYKLGFQLVADNPPDYFYVINGQRKHRWNYRKDILKNTLPNYNPHLTEYQNMINHGYWRVWDCGTLKFAIYNK